MPRGTNRARMRSDFSRVWLQEFRAGPSHAPQYLGQAKAGAASWSFGDITPVYEPAMDRYGEFDTVGKIIGERGIPEVTLTGRYAMDITSTLLRLARNGCDHDVQIHIGECEDPLSFNQGWQKILILEDGRPTEWSTSDLGALEPGERATVTEETPWSGLDLYEIVRMIMGEQAGSQVVQEVIDVSVCDAVTCGTCGIPSNGCDVVFAVTLTAGGSPGLAAEVVYTGNGGNTWDDTNITTLAANENPDALACVGTNLVVISEDSESLHYAPSADILAGVETWTEVTTGFVLTKGPLDIFSADPMHTWIVGEGGYIYFTDDPTGGVSVQSAGALTTQDLKAIHGMDALNLIAVGNSNAVVVTRDGGETWAAETGPAVGVNLNTCWMHSKDVWFVGTAGGKLFYTLDAGTTWTEKAFPGSGAGQVRDIKFTTPSVGYMAHDTATPRGRILRTVDGGYSWYVLPEQGTAATMPLNDRIKALAVCADPNIVYGVGLADNATDGFIVRGSGA